VRGANGRNPVEFHNLHGDIDQLPPVGPGQALADIIASGSRLP
jgi:ATP-dependent exoDNAse (exonuclease V) alpha subunit